MSEIIQVYTKENPDTPIPMERKEFYDEQIEEYKKKGSISKYCEVVNILLLNKDGQLVLQKRSNTKAHNPNLLDKSIGGHVIYRDTIEYTVMVETIQELQVPSIVLFNDKDLKKTINLLKDSLETIAVVKELDTRFASFVKIINGEKVSIGNKTHFFLGLYDGKVRFADKEAKGIMFYSMDELEKELNNKPEEFTEDIKYIIKEFGSGIKKFISEIKSL